MINEITVICSTVFDVVKAVRQEQIAIVSSDPYGWAIR